MVYGSPAYTGDPFPVAVAGIDVLRPMGEVLSQFGGRHPVPGIDHISETSRVQLGWGSEDADMAQLTGLALSHAIGDEPVMGGTGACRNRVDLRWLVEGGDSGEHVIEFLNEGAEQITEEPGDRDHHIHA